MGDDFILFVKIPSVVQESIDLYSHNYKYIITIIIIKNAYNEIALAYISTNSSDLYLRLYYNAFISFKI